MKLITKLLTGILTLGAINFTTITYILYSKKKITVGFQGTRRMNKNPMDDVRRRNMYMGCRYRAFKSAEFCRNRWLKND